MPPQCCGTRKHLPVGWVTWDETCRHRDALEGLLGHRDTSTLVQLCCSFSAPQGFLWGFLQCCRPGGMGLGESWDHCPVEERTCQARSGSGRWCCLRAELLEHRLVKRFGAHLEKRRQKFLMLLAGCMFVVGCMGWPLVKYKGVKW